MQKQPRKQLKQNVTKMDNEYVRQKDERKKARRKATFYVKRRMFLLLIATIVVLSGLMMSTIAKKEELVERQKIELKVTERLEEVKQDQEILKTQVKKLEDDEYILKLARKEYFLSEEGEIIFTMPTKGNENDKDDEKNSEDVEKDSEQ